jgi:threonine aldolase
LYGLTIDPEDIKTNIVYFEITREDIPAAELEKRLNHDGIRILAPMPGRLRAVTHYHITADDIDFTLGVFSKILK